MKTLIVYGTKYGTAEKCSNILKDKLQGEYKVINIKRDKITDLETFDNIVIGGSIYAGNIQKEVKDFCSSNLDTLKNKKIGLFICCMNEDNPETQINAAFPQELLDQAIIKESFGGEFKFQKMNFFERLIIKMVSKGKKDASPMDMSKDISKISEDRINKFAQVINN